MATAAQNNPTPLTAINKARFIGTPIRKSRAPEHRSFGATGLPYNYPRNASPAKASCGVAVLKSLMSLRRITAEVVSSSTLFAE
jgi:hypothetical protein